MGNDVVDWEAAACRDHDPEMFFPIGYGPGARHQIDAAKRVCAQCSVSTRCLGWAIDAGIAEGVWGGHTEDERRVLRRQLDRSARAATTRA